MGFVFPIYKNGSSTLKQLAHKTYINNQIERYCDKITVFLRDPKERFVSGAFTYVQHLIKDNPELDPKTVMYFVKNFPFLNKHFMPQTFWVANLATYISWQCELILRPMSELHEMTDLNVNHTSDRIDEEFERDVLKTISLDSYLELDQALMENVGTTVSWGSFIIQYKEKNPRHYQSIFGTAQRLAHVLPQA
jgi:hypothetical protein